MAVVETKSTQITNRDASPKAITNGYITKGNIVESIGTVEAANGDSAASTFRMASIPSNARILDVILACDALGGSAAADVGLYDTTENGGAVVDADLFASAQSLASALGKTNVTHESGVFGISDIEKRVWEALGLTEDPKKDYDVVVTLTAATAAAGTISLAVKYAM